MARPDLTHGDRVHVGGFEGRPGTVVRCHRLRDGAVYFKVRLDTTGDLVWPDHVVAESSGPHEHRCRECAIRYRSNTPQASICPNCQPPDVHDLDDGTVDDLIPGTVSHDRWMAQEKGQDE